MKFNFLFVLFLITCSSYAQENKVLATDVVNNTSPNTNSLFDDLEILETKINNIIIETIKQNFITQSKYNNLITLFLQQNNIINDYVKRLKALDLISLELQKQIEEEQINKKKQIEDLKNCIRKDNK